MELGFNEADIKEAFKFSSDKEEIINLILQFQEEGIQINTLEENN